MKPVANRFFTRGGFSSSQWNHIEQINDVDLVDSFYPNSIPYDLIIHQSKSRKDYPRFRCGLSA